MCWSSKFVRALQRNRGGQGQGACRPAAKVQLSHYSQSQSSQRKQQRSSAAAQQLALLRSLPRCRFLTCPPERLRRSRRGRSLWSPLYWCRGKRSSTSSPCAQCLWRAGIPFPGRQTAAVHRVHADQRRSVAFLCRWRIVRLPGMFQIRADLPSSSAANKNETYSKACNKPSYVQRLRSSF